MNEKQDENVKQEIKEEAAEQKPAADDAQLSDDALETVAGGRRPSPRKS